MYPSTILKSEIREFYEEFFLHSGEKVMFTLFDETTLCFWSRPEFVTRDRRYTHKVTFELLRTLSKLEAIPVSSSDDTDIWWFNDHKQ